MTKKIEFCCLPTIIGTMPHTNPDEACLLVNNYLPDLPAWPQLPQRDSAENMYVQYSEGFPGIVVENGKPYVDQDKNFDEQIERFYNDYEEKKFSRYGVSGRNAAGLHTFKALSQERYRMVKGQVTGPISWGLCVTDREQRGILYDDLLADTAAKFLRLKAMWQEDFLRSFASQTIIFIDEPYLTSLGTAFTAISSETVSTLLEEVLAGISGISGIHCCGSTDWSLLLRSSTDIISFDAYNYADSLSTYAADVNDYLRQGGTIAWGIVTNCDESLEKETVPSLYDRLGEAMAPYTREGITFKQLAAQSILTPSCGLATLSIDAATEALHLLSELSEKMRSRYC